MAAVVADFEGVEALKNAADEGSLQDEQWANMFPSILQRLEHNVFTEFPLPRTPPSTAHPPIQPSPLPHDLQSSYLYIRDTLNTTFPTRPPHTIQRFAELLLSPRAHHRFLPAYLTALDRVLSVSSSLNHLPHLSAPAPDLPNGTHPGSDESLGGALLTPIPWLRNTTAGQDAGAAIASPTRAGSETDQSTPSTSALATPETASQSDSADERAGGAITQGELLRQEQQASSPPTPVASLAAARHASPDAAAAPIEDPEEPHARGPETIGLEDTGLQRAGGSEHGPRDMAAAAGREMQIERKDGDGDVEIKDADGDVDAGGSGEEEKVEEAG